MQTIEKSNKKKQKQFWSEFSDDYLDSLYQNVKEYPSLLLRHRYILDLLGSKSGYIADIGCGPGEMLCDLLDRGCRVYGVDIAEGMLELAEKNIQKRHPGAEYALHVGNVEELDIKDNTFDAVICAGVIEYMRTDTKTLSELHRILKPGGDLIITVRNMACPFRIIDLLSDKVKATDSGLKLLDAFKRSKGGDRVRFIPYRKHWPWKFDSDLERFGLIKQDFRYFHFYPFFTPFHIIFPKYFLKYGLKLERLTNHSFGFLGSGYIVKAQKK